MIIETTPITLNTSAEKVFEFLNKISNFELLMPESISKFEVLSEERFLFAIKGMPEIVLQKNDSRAHEFVLLGAASDKLPFTLRGDIKKIDENMTEVQLVFEGSFNTMMEMMIKTPITNFINALSENLQKVGF